MTQLFGLKFLRLPQSSSLAQKGFDVVLYGGQAPFEEDLFEQCYSACFLGHRKPGENSSVFRQFFQERGIPGCSTNRAVQTPGSSL